jgi:hypothetical protein
MDGKKGERPAFGKILKFGRMFFIQATSLSGLATPNKLPRTTLPDSDSSTLPTRDLKPEIGKLPVTLLETMRVPHLSSAQSTTTTPARR